MTVTISKLRHSDVGDVFVFDRVDVCLVDELGYVVLGFLYEVDKFVISIWLQHGL